jgi:hypothetical protein
MGRMKEVYMEIMQANNGIPENLTISDMKYMDELKIYEWKEYERTKEKKEFFNKNSKEIAKAAKAAKKFSSRNEGRETKN